jgi:hypothetical protein
MRLALAAADSTTDPSIIILGAWGAAVRPKAGDVNVVIPENEVRRNGGEMGNA